MKKKFIIAFSIIFAIAGVSAQENKPVEKTITDAEFKAVVQKSDDKTKGKNYRLKKSSKTFLRSDNSLSRSSSETFEFMMPDASRSVSEGGSAGETSTTTETIRIGDKIYTRIGNGGWQTITSSRTNTLSTKYDSIEHIYKGAVKLGTKQVFLYESKYTNKTVKGGRDFVTVTKVKNWFGADGILLKTEEEIETPNTLTNRIVEYEYNVNVKIQAPIK